MSNVEVGQLLDGSEQRDAIHIAIAPVVAGEFLSPADPINFRDDGDTTIVVKCEAALAVGIVDPFLKREIRSGDRFYMFLHPNTITSLRHEWTHPAFRGAPPAVDVSFSEQWIRDFCNTHDAPDADTMISAIKNGGEWDSADASIRIDGDYIYVGGMDAHGEIPDEFWRHAEIIAGHKFSTKPERFSCSC